MKCMSPKTNKVRKLFCLAYYYFQYPSRKKNTRKQTTYKSLLMKQFEDYPATELEDVSSNIQLALLLREYRKI